MDNSPLKIFPSLISADLLNLGKEIELLAPICDGFHIDVMDGQFVPNLTWGFPFIKAIKTATDKPLCIHLMVQEPEAIARRLELAAGDTIAFHIEAVTAPQLIINYLHEKKLRPAIALKPSTVLEKIFPYLTMVNEVLLMSVEPGFSGQEYLPISTERLKRLTEYRMHHKLTFSISMDGGLNAKNLPILVQLGLNKAAIASAIFSHPDRSKALKNLYACAD